MRNFDNVKTLNKQALFELLSQRVNIQEAKLSQIPDPLLLRDAHKAVKRIAQAVKEREKITLIGDYDVDGVASTAIMVEFFRQIPYPLEAIIPNRFSDGYGVSPNILKRVDTDLIITVDNGISAIEAAEICKQKGIDLIITDHHTPSDVLPDAYAIINPKLSSCTYPFEEICGAQVAWLLLALLKKELSLSIDMKYFIDMLAIAIIADIMPLTHINRALVKEGLRIIQSSNKPSCTIIRDFLNKKTITSEDIGFQIAPRLNSAGRIEDASIALEFLTAQSTSKAFELFEKLNSLNELRKEEEANATKEALLLCNPNDKIIVVAQEFWHEGVVGIVASRLVDRFEKPAIVLSIDNGIAKGSARSIGDVSIYELIKANEELLLKFGGHKMAAGLLLDAKNIEIFKKAINKSASYLAPEHFLPSEDVVGVLPFCEIDFELLDILERFEPYGEANTRPLFLIKDAEVVKIETFGKEKSHSKVLLREFENEKKEVELILFKNILQMPESKKLTCSYRTVKNEFNSKVSVQLIINKIYNY
ncbi:MAG: single-stranded-DNA-specific exonuclease [Campylobacterota bacterium]|nr:single-stranded-DNA-specific exonuclease [Campylobacterota bacterium]